MRKLYPLIFFLSLIITFSRAQNPTPNPGFETWDDTTVSGEQFYVPRDWNNLDPATALIALTCIQTTNSHSGKYAVELITKVIFGDTANGIITTGNINISTKTITGGIPFNLRPDSMYGWYEYFPAKGDSTDIEFDLFDKNDNMIGQAAFTTGDTMKMYKRFSAPVIYTDTTSIPDTSQWLISSSNGYKSYPGSILYIDDIGLIGPGAGINTPALNPVTISVMPNPASGFISFSNPKLIQGIVSLFNDAGAEVKQFQLSSDRQSIDVHDLASGDYLYSITDKIGNRLATGTIILK